MGLFDSYYAPWRHKRVEIQTKQLEPQMGVFELADFVPHLSSYSKQPCFIVEDFGFEHYAQQQHFAVLCHLQGQWVDVCFCSQEDIASVQHRMDKNWQSPKRSAHMLLELNRFISYQKKQLKHTISNIQSVQYQYQRFIDEQDPNKKALFPALLPKTFDFTTQTPTKFTQEILDQHRTTFIQSHPSDPPTAVFCEDDFFSAPLFTPPLQPLVWSDFKTPTDALTHYIENVDFPSITQALELYPHLLDQTPIQTQMSQLLQDALCSIWTAHAAAKLIIKFAPNHNFLLHLHPSPIHPDSRWGTLSWLVQQGLPDALLAPLIPLVVPHLNERQSIDLFQVLSNSSFEPLYSDFFSFTDPTLLTNSAWIDRVYQALLHAHHFDALHNAYLPEYPLDPQHHNALDELLKNRAHTTNFSLTPSTRLSHQEEFLLHLAHHQKALISKIQTLKDPHPLFLQRLTDIEKDHLEIHTPDGGPFSRTPPRL